MTGPRRNGGTDPAAGRAAAPPPMFLERQSYRRRRLMDAARLLPLLGALLFAVPLLWPGADAAGGDAAEPVRLSGAILYIFAVWGGLIAVITGFGIVARRWTQSDAAPETGPG